MIIGYEESNKNGIDSFAMVFTHHLSIKHLPITHPKSIRPILGVSNCSSLLTTHE